MYINSIQIAVDYPSGKKIYPLMPSRKAIGIVLGRRRYDALAKYAFKHNQMQMHFIYNIARAIRAEIRSLNHRLTVVL